MVQDLSIFYLSVVAAVLEEITLVAVVPVVWSMELEF
tara:strand:+ start:257 stop:367 length:111 start_codon:yes stop_codon:yes gene_type:complete